MQGQDVEDELFGRFQWHTLPRLTLFIPLLRLLFSLQKSIQKGIPTHAGKGEVSYLFIRLPNQ